MRRNLLRDPRNEGWVGSPLGREYAQLWCLPFTSPKRDPRVGVRSRYGSVANWLCDVSQVIHTLGLTFPSCKIKKLDDVRSQLCLNLFPFDSFLFSASHIIPRMNFLFFYSTGQVLNRKTKTKAFCLMSAVITHTLWEIFSQILVYSRSNGANGRLKDFYMSHRAE